jgi:hypothetical protein
MWILMGYAIVRMIRNTIEDEPKRVRERRNNNNIKN